MSPTAHLLIDDMCAKLQGCREDSRLGIFGGDRYSMTGWAEEGERRGTGLFVSYHAILSAKVQAQTKKMNATQVMSICDHI